ncbi:MAG: glycosyltransferase family 9 protein [Chitinophagaceae bacterium]|nr:glycosyltransferase family 9 protein [Chitinophagaceae bacterium]
MPEKFLVIQTAFIGDVVLATSLVENIHAAYPGSTIDFLLRKGNESLLDGHPYLRRILIWNKNEKKTAHLLKLLREIRHEKYDAVINVQRYAATGILTAFSGAKKRIGFDKNPLSFLFSRKIKHQFSGVHEIERNHLLISHFIKDPVKKPRLYPSMADEEKVMKYADKPFITISPASVWFTKQYPPLKWAAFINDLPPEYSIYLLGGPDDRSLCEAIIQMTTSKSPVDLCGELSFLQSAALMRHAHMNFVNDSAPMHFASAVNAPVTAVYCSTVPNFGYGPLSDKKFIIERTAPLYCRPCGLHGYAACPQGHFKCALEIEEKQLLNALKRET